jgi:ABC-type nitrate/sulfonate/bicarbonate transport system substrate-binding protein
MDVHESPSRRRALAIGLAGAGAFSASLLGTRSGRAADLTPLHIATNVSESAANAYFAEDQGFFKEQGLDAKIDSFASGGQYTNGIVSGSFDVGAVGCGSLVSAHAKGIPFVLLANGGIYNFESPQTMLVVAKGSTLKNAIDFRGKTIAVSTLGDTVHVAVMAWLDKNGQDPKAALDPPLRDPFPNAAVLGDLTDVLAGTVGNVFGQNDVRVFGGGAPLAMWDVAAASAMYDLSRQLGIGKDISLYE